MWTDFDFDKMCEKLAKRENFSFSRWGDGEWMGCPDGMVSVGQLCVDKYEASVWNSAGDTQYGASGDDYLCDDDGKDCAGAIYAYSVEGETPSRYITWFQAQQACAVADE